MWHRSLRLCVPWWRLGVYFYWSVDDFVDFLFEGLHDPSHAPNLLLYWAERSLRGLLVPIVISTSDRTFPLHASASGFERTFHVLNMEPGREQRIWNRDDNEGEEPGGRGDQLSTAQPSPQE